MGMSFNNDTNAGRVNKIMDLLQLIQKSGVSNGIDREDMWNMLERPINLMGEMIGEEPDKPEPLQDLPKVPEPVQTVSGRNPRWVDARQMVQELPIKDLSIVLAVFLSRFDELELK